jgi:diguanylate cyclase (GGDEF)-like protein
LSQRLLLIDPDPTRGMELYAALRDLRVEAELVVDAEQGWRRFAAIRPGVVIAALGSGGKSGGGSFLRRLRDEYMGALPATYLLCAAEDLPAAAALDPDACLVPPISRSALAAIAGAAAGGGVSLDSGTRLRELFDLSLLGGDVVRGLDALVGRAALAFQVNDCAAWAWGGDGHTWPRVSRPIGQAERAELFDRVRLASAAGRTVLLAPRAGKNAVTEAAGHSILALPLVSGELVLGGVALLTDGARLYDPVERDALVLLARRMTAELAWVSAHARLLVEHERLREAALLDPLTGVWNRSALEQAITTQIQAAARMPQALTLMVIDVIRLAAINDKHGHKTGDAVLAHLAGLIAANLRAHDVVGRAHGDEFVVLLVGCDAKGAKAAADHVRAGVRRAPYRLGEARIEFEIRIGISEIRPGEDAGAPALARAEAAMRRTRARTTEVSAVDGTDDSFSGEPATADRDAIPAGVTLGGMYRVLHEISRGAMGVVYRGEDLGLGRQVALKVLRADLASDEALVARFRAEAAMLASIHHTNMVQVYTFGTDGDLVYFVMELVEGEAVADVMTRVEQSGVPIELGLIAKVTHEIASALDAIHAVGIVHRDVKPDNILIDRVHDRAVLVDVGVAKRRGSEREAAGTPGFAAPESFMDRDPSLALDVYGLAATAYAMLTGLPPFGSGELLPVFERQTQESPARPSLLRPGLSTEVDQVLLRALAADPARRQRSASAFAFALGRALEQSGDGMAVPIMEMDDEVAHTQRYPSVRTDERGALRQPLECRGQFFRSAYLTLGRQCGTSWLVQVGGESAILARLVRPSTPADGWHATDLLGMLLQRSQGHEKARREAAHQLGQAALSAGFDQLVIGGGKRIESLLREAPEVWNRFFRGSTLAVDELGAASIRVTVDPGPGNRLVCALIEGWLMRLVELVGASSVLPEHPQHAVGAGGPCRFALRWE